MAEWGIPLCCLMDLLVKNVSVDVSRNSNRCMPQYLAHDLELRAAFQCIGGKVVSQLMGAQLPDAKLDTGPP